MTEIEIGEYGFVVDDFVAEHIRLLEWELDNACRRMVEKGEHVDRLEQWLRLIADVCVDYDGYRSIVGLLCLVDDLQGMARRALAGDELYIGVDDDWLNEIEKSDEAYYGLVDVGRMARVIRELVGKIKLIKEYCENAPVGNVLESDGAIDDILASIKALSDDARELIGEKE